MKKLIVLIMLMLGSVVFSGDEVKPLFENGERVGVKFKLKFRKLRKLNISKEELIRRVNKMSKPMMKAFKKALIEMYKKGEMRKCEAYYTEYSIVRDSKASGYFGLTPISVEKRKKTLEDIKLEKLVMAGKKNVK